jgi:hypothetical protein
MNLTTISAMFTSRLRSEQVAAKLGAWLGVSFTVAFATGLFSHFLQHPPAWLWPFLGCPCRIRRTASSSSPGSNAPGWPFTTCPS